MGMAVWQLQMFSHVDTSSVWALLGCFGSLLSPISNLTPIWRKDC